MARQVNGASSIIDAARLICRMVGRFGVSPFAAATSNVPEFAVAVTALVAACQLFDAADDWAGQIDDTAPEGPEDVIPI